MFLLESATVPARQDLVFTATDLVTASECEYRLLRVLDEKLGRSAKPMFDADEMLQRAADLGDVHERRVLNGYIQQFGPWNPSTGRGVYNVEPVATTDGKMDRGLLAAKHKESLRALHGGADVVFQAAFFDGIFHGRSDFLVHQPDGSYAVFDTKLARSAKVGALLQLAAYGDQLLAAGIPLHRDMTLVLGNGTLSEHAMRDVLPVFRERRRRLLEITAARQSENGPVQWGDPRFTACGRCDYCAEQVEATRDVLLVAGMTLARRRRLRDEGIGTIDQLAAIPTGNDATMARYIDQARLQLGLADVDGSVTYQGKDGSSKVLSYEVLPDNTLDRLPAPSPGDIFFDFEGDPLWQDPLTGSWGLEYLFGVVEYPQDANVTPPFKPFWAHSRAAEKQAFADFLDYVAERRQRYPDLHIYHYAAYEKSALRRLSVLHVIGEAAVDNLLRDGVLVDLYETVRHSLRISERSYSIKKLEPLYMGNTLRAGEVTDAGASVVAYSRYCDAVDDEKPEEAATILRSIADYNEYDCLSTLRLRDWLLALQQTHPRNKSTGPDATAGALREPRDQKPYEAQPEETLLLDFVAAQPALQRTSATNQAIAMVGAAVGYHRREAKQFWWGHFDRLATDPETWAQTRDVFLVAAAEVYRGWERPNPRSSPSRILKLTGRLAEGSSYKPGMKLFRMYAAPLPDALEAPLDSSVPRAGWFGTEVLDVDRSGEQDVVFVLEKLRKGADEHDQLPMALTPDQPVSTKGQREALSELAVAVGRSLPTLPAHPALDLLCRRPPRLATGSSLPVASEDPHGYIDAITAAIADLDRSYLAVQGPPGSGKTHVGSHVIANLVARGWKVGVVGQSHAVIENLLARAVTVAGVPAERTAKKPEALGSSAPWLHTTDEDMARLLSEEGGALVGGTAWAMTGSKIPPASLDLLVIDEAGQFSLANTLAVARATKRLLLLGDPQQLPQVTQGSHPEPVDESALGWLSQGHATLPPQFGYFLATTWRMHPALCERISALSYDGRLHAAPTASQRHLTGAAPGVACVLVQHSGNTVRSPEEAGEVIRQVRAHLGLAWVGAAGQPARPLTPGDLLVVAAYNAQVDLIAEVLERAGLSEVRVGTVDRFQGQEAPVVLVSMAASLAAEAPRGPDFLLSRNRVNVAVSRGQWRTVVIRSPELTSFLPTHPKGLKELGAFMALCEP